MEKLSRVVLLLILSILAPISCANHPPSNDDEQVLNAKIGQLLVVGFVGMQPSSGVVDAIEKYRVGGVILFEKNLSNKLPKGGFGQRNIESPAQLRKLTDSLQTLARMAGLPKLFIAIDQEGGLVNRLKAQYGFPSSVSAQYQGEINNEDTTKKYAASAAATLVAAGLNLNFAPCTDLAINPQNPIIAKVKRSFGASSDLVTRHSKIWVDQLNQAGILTSLKHFPGHGSSRDDSHLGLPDISATWQEIELEPYRNLIDAGYNDIVMVGHLMCSRFDDQLPSSLSKKTIAFLRDSLHYQGVVATDDLNMGAIVANYSLERALELALNAGVDMIVMGNNASKFEPDLVERTIHIIKGLVADGKVSIQTIDAAYNRVMALKMRNRSL